ncbi:hypothetical protein LTR62_006129 [Meristemomyces frigidus]|uniref:Uncharacterized protein n=1 Tax=Meristemomyces frigidus TaxID=1508187 RepID=A0AAN7TCX4_9PEZI|nr:hypothetical protein LTR62_006129 [Meristemomyces frigidus]
MSTCEAGNQYDGRIGTRISAIFVILVGSFLGAWFPVFAARHKDVSVPGWAFFIAKYFGSGVIVATAFIHLLAPANEALTDPCLTGPITEYSWTEGICLIVIFVMFFLELMTMRYAKFGHSHDHEHSQDVELAKQAKSKKADRKSQSSSSSRVVEPSLQDEQLRSAEACAGPHVPGDDHLSHNRQHLDMYGHDDGHHDHKTFDPDSYAAQMTAIAILEFGVIFHSIFIGLTLAVAGKEFITLYVVLVFHQTFEGLALGTRLASIKWPSTSRWTPYVLGGCYALSTPIAISIGLGVRTGFAPGSQTTLIVNGVFDSISAGILIYTGLIELMAHEFMFSEYMQKAPIREVLAALGFCDKAATMSLTNILFKFLPGFCYSQFFVTPPDPETDCTGKTVIVTGSNTGLGKETVRHFVRLNAEKVIIACRSIEKGEAAKQDIERISGRHGVVEVWKLDLQDYDSVKAFAQKAQGLRRLDIVIENAGINTFKYVSAAGNESTITVNVVSTFLLALLLLPKLQESGKITATTPTLTIVSSEVHFLTALPEKSAPSIFDKLNDQKSARMSDRYNVSKLMEVFACREIARQHPAEQLGVTLNFINPGLCNSELSRELDIAAVRFMLGLFARTTEVGARTLVHAGLSGKETHGKYLSDSKVTHCAPLVEGRGGAELQSRVWKELADRLDAIQPGVLKVLDV